MTEYIQIVTTVENEDDAKKIAELLVKRRLAACVQIVGPVTSYFRWDGKIDTAGEYQVIIKSRTDLFPELESVLTEAHPYDVPEILAIPILAGGEGYLNWLSEELKR
ncbi:MAG: divalent-cation tolerance protein CutA [Desulfobulbaceae bacterium]|nr:divalent-cation tolerance protein CutA [Desulfobulbaceae bacterium]MCK5322695.1 divalent-cation tolerance protein CutA [Desulfobulbaceae bacterium]MCK5437233.1 divalent-cation tolerance protein CutA [Desulfobulbaceae bacterium]MCK5543582.1 divalent-cation tolerance protein CutA [Desulfobulbaceae bacterium]